MQKHANAGGGALKREIDRVEQIFAELPEKIRMGLLFGVYGAQLNEHRRKIVSLWLDDDYSLSEIADELNITRQGVHDAIKKSEKVLYEMEETLGIARRVLVQQEMITHYQQLTQQMDSELSGMLNDLRLLWEDNPWPLKD